MQPTIPRQRTYGQHRERARRIQTLDSMRFSKPGAPTLERRIGETWTQLVEQGKAECPVCANELRATGCTSCGSTLA